MGCGTIPDRNLRIALLDSVRCRSDESWLEELRADYEALGVEPGWEALDEYIDRLPALEELIAQLPVTPEQLSRITQLTFDGDRDVYACYPDWWHIDPEHFTIRNLRGIEGCVNLEYLSLGQGLVMGCSLEPLRELLNLRDLSLCAQCDHREIEAVLDLPLQRISVVNGKTDPAWQAVIAELRDRGCAIY